MHRWRRLYMCLHKQYMCLHKKNMCLHNEYIQYLYVHLIFSGCIWILYIYIDGAGYICVYTNNICVYTNNICKFMDTVYIHSIYKYMDIVYIHCVHVWFIYTYIWRSFQYTYRSFYIDIWFFFHRYAVSSAHAQEHCCDGACHIQVHLKRYLYIWKEICNSIGFFSYISRPLFIYE